MFTFYNPNPQGNYVGDCVIRALCKLLDRDWESVYLDVCLQGFMMKDMPSANHVWGAYLRSQGYSQHTLPNTCPDCYTVQDFCNDYPQGKYMLATDTHVIAVETKKRYQKYEVVEQMVIIAMQNLCDEITDFVSELYHNTETEAERAIIIKMINDELRSAV